MGSLTTVKMVQSAPSGRGGEDAESVNNLLKAMKAEATSIERRIKVAATLETLATSSEDKRKEIFVSGGTEILVQSLSIGNFDIKMHVVAIINAMATTQTCRKVLVQNRALPAVVSVLRTPDIDCQLRAMQALTTLAATDQIKCEIVNVGAIPLVIGLLTNGDASRGVPVAATFLLRELARCEAVEATQWVGLDDWTLAASSTADANSAVDHLKVTDANEWHSAMAGEVTPGAADAEVDSACQHITLTAQTPMELSGFRTRMHQVWNGPSFMYYRFCYSEDDGETWKDAKVGMKTSQDNREWQQVIFLEQIAIYWKLSMWSDQEICSFSMEELQVRVKKANVDIIVDAGVLAPLIDMLSSPDEVTQLAACDTLVEVAVKVETQLEVERLGAIPTLLGMLKNGSAKTKEAATGALATLALSDDCSLLFEKAGVHLICLQMIKNGSDTRRYRQQSIL